MSSNDNHAAPPASVHPMPDAHGHAALLLVESLIHGLLARSIISIGDAIEIVESADSVQVDIAEEADGAGAPMWQARGLLTAILKSLSYDADGNSAPLHPVDVLPVFSSMLNESFPAL